MFFLPLPPLPLPSLPLASPPVSFLLCSHPLVPSAMSFSLLHSLIVFLLTCAFSRFPLLSPLSSFHLSLMHSYPFPRAPLAVFSSSCSPLYLSLSSLALFVFLPPAYLVLRGVLPPCTVVLLYLFSSRPHLLLSHTILCNPLSFVLLLLTLSSPPPFFNLFFLSFFLYPHIAMPSHCFPPLFFFYDQARVHRYAFSAL